MRAVARVTASYRRRMGLGRADVTETQRTGLNAKSLPGRLRERPISEGEIRLHAAREGWTVEGVATPRRSTPVRRYLLRHAIVGLLVLLSAGAWSQQPAGGPGQLQGAQPPAPANMPQPPASSPLPAPVAAAETTSLPPGAATPSLAAWRGLRVAK